MNSINLIKAKNTGGRIDVGQATGSTEMLMFVYDLAPGQGSSPYHYEYDEEWLLVVEGTVVVRTPDGEQTFERGDLVCFPAGPAGAHKVMNRGDAPARTLLFSRRGLGYAISVYPDSDTIGVWAGGEDDLVFERKNAVPWAYGEEGWKKAT
ncbi:MAG TPA: cupin domain-containing protein [Gaiellaceae bacterium]